MLHHCQLTFYEQAFRPVLQENLSFVEQAGKPVADNGARYQLQPTVEFDVKSYTLSPTNITSNLIPGSAN
jgi:hypothetical protein